MAEHAVVLVTTDRDALRMPCSTRPYTSIHLTSRIILLAFRCSYLVVTCGLQGFLSKSKAFPHEELLFPRSRPDATRVCPDQLARTMLVCIVGPPQAGKKSLADHLVRERSFTRVHLVPSLPTSRSQDDLYFTSSSDFLDHATRTWRRHYVTVDLVSKAKLAEFAKRPFVAVVAVDAPLGVRFRRAVAVANSAGETPPSLDDFVEADDRLYHGALPLLSQIDGVEEVAELFGSRLGGPGGPATPAKKRPTQLSNDPPSPTPSPFKQISPEPSPELSRTRLFQPAEQDSLQSLAQLPPADSTLSSILPLAHLTIPNPHSSLGPFLSSFSLPVLAELLRPSWDTYFMLLASLASLRSNCMKRRVGAVLVRDKRVVSTGYNGTPRGVKNCSEGGCGRCNSHGDGFGDEADPEGVDDEAEMLAANGQRKGMSRVGEALDECLCLHAEENALLEAGRERVSGGGTEGATLYCNTCPCLRCTVKIVQCGVEEVIYSLSYSMDSASRRVMEEAGVVLRQIPQPPFPK
ncbi:Deoxycytidylate deaminase [Rhodotorula toruloides]|nr:Deoxycytidylate deaminase [Rhodotorula toruloides]